MLQDCRGLNITAPSPEAVFAFDTLVDLFLHQRVELMPGLEGLLKQHPNFAMANVFRGYMLLMAYKAELVPAARAALEAASAYATTERERLHVEVLGAWADNRADLAARRLRDILRADPLDILAFRVLHFLDFWAGRTDMLLHMVRAVEPAWTEDTPGWPLMLGCRCFAFEEAGHYLEAETTGREAVQLDARDLWAIHGVAHTPEMTGRPLEGIAWIGEGDPDWSRATNFVHHLWWHLAMYHLELEDDARVLDLYDQRFRNLNSKLTAALPDLYIDVQNAASMLYRLGRHGVDVGDRWTEIADKADARIGDCRSAFTLPHWMMALAATGRDAAARRMLAEMRNQDDTPAGQIVREIAVPVCEAVLANGQGRHTEAVNAMWPILGEMWRLGGSHAQQEVLEQVFLDSALKSGATVETRMLLQRVSGRHPVPPSRRRGYAMAPV